MTIKHPHRSFVLLCIAIACVVSGSVASIAAKQENDSFQDVLALAGLGREALATLSTDAEYGTDDWQLFAQLVYRLRQFPPAQLESWAVKANALQWNETSEEHLGQFLAITATIESVESVDPPEDMAAETVLPQLYRCRFRLFDKTASGDVLVPRVPSDWQHWEISEEPVRFLGVRLGNMPNDDGQMCLLLTNHLAWYPRDGVSSGRLLLSREGMDISLLDEVKQRQPFVKPEVSREGEAFYQCLLALATVDHQELATLAVENVADTARHWLTKLPVVQQRQAELRHKLAGAPDSAERDTLQKQLETARRDLALATAVEKQADRKLSSVAPLFLQPEEQVGELVRIEGIARRAVRIAASGGAADQAFSGERVSTPTTRWRCSPQIRRTCRLCAA